MEKQASWISGYQGWKTVVDQSLYNSGTIFQYMNGAAEPYLAFNFRVLKSVRFEKPGMSSIVVEVCDMASPKGEALTAEGAT